MCVCVNVKSIANQAGLIDSYSSDALSAQSHKHSAPKIMAFLFAASVCVHVHVLVCVCVCLYIYLEARLLRPCVHCIQICQ